VGWQFTDDCELYAERVWPLLSSAPAELTVALTSLDALRSGRRWSSEPVLLGWYDDDGAVRGAVSLTPPYELLLTVVPPGSEDELVAQLRSRAVQVPGVMGETELADRIASSWIRGTTMTAETFMRLRLYGLTHLTPPAPSPAGRALPAGAADGGLAIRWFTAFGAEAGAPIPSVEETVHDRISQRLLWLWRDATGEPVAMAARQRTICGVARIGPVYTPPERRRHGYGMAVTAACSEDALDRGARHVVLFADLANSTSNTIYQRIGFSPLGDRKHVRFMVSASWS
jgi:GNAT superfamily N-acetyltransferase